MMQQLRHRSRHARALWIALLLLALVWQPGLLSVSEVHASAHLLQTGHAMDAAHGDRGVPADEADTADPWHALMHLGHCCGHPSAMTADTLHVASPTRVVSPPVGRTFDATSASLSQPLRPPIAG